MSQEKNFIPNLKDLPTKPGCYLFYDEKETLLYVGKAKNLKKRVSNYFQKNKKSPKTELLVSKIQKIETRITNSEIESLILENNLIKEHRPRFNILLRDDKNFLYLRITNEDFPRIEIVRKINKDGAFYFGPKTSAKGFRKTISFCQKIFRIRTCKVEISNPGSEQSENIRTRVKISKNPENRRIPCLDFHIKKCSAPCSGEISATDYQKDVKNLKSFLRGKNESVIKGLQEKMMKFAEEKNFEAAGKLRDLVTSIETSTEKQVVQFVKDFDADFINFFREGNAMFFVRILFRNGKFLDQNEIEFKAPGHTEDSEILEKFLVQFYEKVDEIPKEVFLPIEIENQELVEELWKTKLKLVQKGDKKKILRIAEKNAKNFAKKSQLEKMSQRENFAKALPELAKTLELKSVKRIECYDISHFAGKNTVASRAVFINGKPAKSEYRKYKIKTLADGKIDDFAAMNEVLERRFNRLDEQIDLIVIDGGKGQLSAVMKAVTKFDFKKIYKKKNDELEKEAKEKQNTSVETTNLGVSKDKTKNKDKKKKIEIEKFEFNPQSQIISLAKKEEQIFRPNIKEPIELPYESPALQLLQRIRDEAHRFAISFNRSSRKKEAHKSILDEIPSIGGTTKKKLLQTFGSVKEIKNSSDEELRKVLSQTQIKNLRKFI